MSNRSAGGGGGASAPRRIVSDDDVHDALDFLFTSARKLADARQRMMECASYVKRTKAIIMKQYSGQSLGAQEREAIIDERYQKAEAMEAEAVGEFEYLKAVRDAKAACIECWRTETATLRSMRI